MSDLSLFLKEKKIKKENIKYKATTSLRDEKGEPLEWELRALQTKDNEKIKKDCTTLKIVNGRQISEFDNKTYTAKVIVKAVVDPDLNNAQLQDSYGVKTAEDLLYEMVDNPTEFNALFEKIVEYSGFEVTDANKVKVAKN